MSEKVLGTARKKFHTLRSRIHKLIFCASDVFGAIGGLGTPAGFGLKPDMLSGICSSSPLSVRELSAFTDVPVFSSAQPDTNGLAEVLIGSNKRSRRHEIAVQLVSG